ncbi:MAG: hypothetical protein ACI9C3_000763 [Yoonia sp.]|jgi:hypothetical protein
MMKYLSILTMFTVLTACSTGLGISNVGDTAFETGPLNCSIGSVQAQSLIVNPNADPVLCGPQSRPIGG